MDDYNPNGFHPNPGHGEPTPGKRADDYLRSLKLQPDAKSTPETMANTQGLMDLTQEIYSIAREMSHVTNAMQERLFGMEPKSIAVSQDLEVTVQNTLIEIKELLRETVHTAIRTSDRI